MIEAFDGDSFFTLSLLQRVGLVALSLLLLGGFASGVYLLGKRVGLFLIPVTCAVYWVMIWLAPQIYYVYYIAIFDGLPWQWVVSMPSVTRLADLALFQTRDSLSEISQGIGFWGLLAAGIVGRLRGT
jgi:hypothetical protein